MTLIFPTPRWSILILKLRWGYDEAAVQGDGGEAAAALAPSPPRLAQVGVLDTRRRTSHCPPVGSGVCALPATNQAARRRDAGPCPGWS